MSDPFRPRRLGPLHLRNAFVRSATWEGLAETDGSATDGLVQLMATLAENGVGLVVTSHAFVDPVGRAGPWQVGIHCDEMVPGLRRVAEAVHAHGGRVFAQLAHAGAHAATRLSGHEALGPSPVEGRLGGVCREMTVDEIRGVSRAMAQAARRAVDAGMDGVQIHAAHAYLLSQFLSPRTNRRADDYGGPLENRARIVLEVAESVRAAVGAGVPVTIKINSEDFFEGGFSQEDMLELAQRLDRAGLDAVEMSGGTPLNPESTHSARKVNPKTPEQEAYYRKAAGGFKNTVNTPLILVGGIRSLGVAEQLIEEGTADFVALSRPLVAEPDLVRRWSSGDRARALCISCNRCYEPILAGKGITCPTFAEAGGVGA